MNNHEVPPPIRALTPRRKRSILAFRRRSDLLWFAMTGTMFVAGAASLWTAHRWIRMAGERRVAEGTLVALSEPDSPAVAEPVGPLGPPSPAVAGASARDEEDKPLPAPEPAARPTKIQPPKPVPAAKPEPARPSLREYSFLERGGPLKTITDGGARIRWKRTTSLGEPALRVDYDLSQGGWVQLHADVKEDFSKYASVQFLFSGEGADRTLEFKLADADGTEAGALWAQPVGRTAWKVVNFPLADLANYWGGDKIFDLKKVRRISFVISKKKGEKGGRGRLTIRGIKIA